MSASVSESIGKLLLEGYKMLADSCEVCCTVLMQDRRGRVICVKCESDSMANAAQERMTPTGKMSNGGSNANVEERDPMGNVSNNSAISSTTPVPRNEAFTTSEEVLTAEIKNSALALQRSSTQQLIVPEKLILVKYIRECAETLQALKMLK